MKLSIRRFTGGIGGAHNASRRWDSRSGLLIELYAGSVRGLGEASPLPGYSPDSLESSQSALGALNLTALEHALNLEDTGTSLRAVVDLLPITQPAARMALETAALDLRGRQCRVSAPALLGTAPGAERALAWLAGSADTRALDTIRGAQRAGYDHFKLKLGRPGNLEAEMAALRELRRALGRGPRLRLDANRGWTESQARRACGVLGSLDIEFLEEPHGTHTPLGGTSVATALDESLQGVAPDDLDALARHSGARFVILKPMVLGGLSHCMELARRASALGLGVVVSHSFDGPVAFAAAAALALSIPTRSAQGLAPHPGLAAWPATALPIARATLRTWHGPGLGLTSDWPD